MQMLWEVVVIDIINLSDTVKEYNLNVTNNNGEFRFQSGQW